MQERTRQRMASRPLRKQRPKKGKVKVEIKPLGWLVILILLSLFLHFTGILGMITKMIIGTKIEINRALEYPEIRVETIAIPTEKENAVKEIKPGKEFETVDVFKVYSKTEEERRQGKLLRNTTELGEPELIETIYTTKDNKKQIVVDKPKDGTKVIKGEIKLEKDEHKKSRINGREVTIYEFKGIIAAVLDNGIQIEFRGHDENASIAALKEMIN